MWRDVESGADKGPRPGIDQTAAKTRGRKPFTPARPGGAPFPERTATGRPGEGVAPSFRWWSARSMVLTPLEAGDVVLAHGLVGVAPVRI
jgi:hypothetical protein